MISRKQAIEATASELLLVLKTSNRGHSEERPLSKEE